MDFSHEDTKRRKIELEEQVDDENETSVELVSVSDAPIEQLNEHCLLEIFSSDTFDLMDLCSIAETCKRFKEITGRVVRKRFIMDRNGDFVDRVTIGKHSSLLVMPSNEGCAQLNRIFKLFGPALASVTMRLGISRDNRATELQLLELVSTYCVDNLKSLEISISLETFDDVMEIPFNLSVGLIPILKQLEELSLEGVFLDLDKTLFPFCPSLVYLNFWNFKNCSEVVLEQVFPKLATFSYTDSNISKTNLLDFISKNSTIKKMRLSIGRSDYTQEVTIPQVIANSCTNLEELRMSVPVGSVPSSYHNYLEPLQKLKSLRVLSLAGLALNADLNVFAAMTELRQLSLRHCTLPKDFNQFACLTQLTNLRVSGYDGNGVINIITHLIHLEYIWIYWDHSYKALFELDEGTFSRICSVVQKRPNVLQVCCKFNFIAVNCDRNQKVRLIQYSSPNDLVVTHSV